MGDCSQISLLIQIKYVCYVYQRMWVELFEFNKQQRHSRHSGAKKKNNKKQWQNQNTEIFLVFLVFLELIISQYSRFSPAHQFFLLFVSFSTNTDMYVISTAGSSKALCVLIYLTRWNKKVGLPVFAKRPAGHARSLDSCAPFANATKSCKFNGNSDKRRWR